MRRDPAALPGLLGRALLAGLTTWVALLSWRDFAVVSSGYLRPLLWLAVLVAVLGTLGRWLRLKAPIVLLVQLVAGLGGASLAIVGGLPLGSDLTRLRTAVSVAEESAQTFASPLGRSVPPIDPLLILAGLAIIVLIDLLACGLRRAPLAGAPLLAALAVPVGILGDLVPWWVFTLVAAGYVSLLFTHERDSAGRWGHRVDDSAPGSGGRRAAVGSSAVLVGASATAVAVLLPLALPGIGLRGLDLGSGSGPGGSGVSVTNPMTDLQRDLRRGADVPVLRVRTDQRDPSYLRIAVLTTFNGQRWTAGDRSIPSDQRADGSAVPLTGVSPDVPRTAYRWDVDVSDLDSTWLPTLADTTRADARGDWRYDTDTGDFIAADDDLDTRGLSYSFDAAALDISGQDLSEAGPSTGAVPLSYTRLPDDLPPIVTQLTDQITAGRATDYAAAAALQDFFQNDFTYDLTRAPVGNGNDALAAFLDPGGDRRGYCEQFASAMAVMAREAGIPARVAVGFLRPEQIGRGEYEYSTHDLHAWPELFFRGYGWVRFEPTPTTRTDSVPGYSRAESADPQDGTSNAPSAQPSTAPSAQPSAAPSRDPRQATPDVGDLAAPQDDSVLPTVLTVLAVLVLLLALAVLPGVLRRRRRVLRLAGDVEAQWSEVRATALDLAAPWPADRSPRDTADELVAHLRRAVSRISEEDRGALTSLARAVEEHRYAPPGRARSDERTRVWAERVLDALQTAAPPRAARRARWLPRTLLQRGSAPATGADDRELVSR